MAWLDYLGKLLGEKATGEDAGSGRGVERPTLWEDVVHIDLVTELRGARLDQLSALPRLGRDPWPVVAAGHAYRHSARPGDSMQQMSLLSAVSALQVLQLDEELTVPSLLGAVLGPWSSQLPPWLAVQLDNPMRVALRDAALDVDAELTPWPQPPPQTSAEVVVRHTLLRSARLWADRLPVDLDAAPLVRTLHITTSPIGRLWADQTGATLPDLATLAARGLLALDPRHWTDSLAGAITEDGVMFERRGPARAAEPKPWRRMLVEEWGVPERWAASPSTPVVRRARRRLRSAEPGGSLVPTGQAGDVSVLVSALSNQRVRQATLHWQPVLGRPLRSSRVTVTGMEIDEGGRLLLLVIWQESHLAVPLRCVAALTWR